MEFYYFYCVYWIIFLIKQLQCVFLFLFCPEFVVFTRFVQQASPALRTVNHFAKQYIFHTVHHVLKYWITEIMETYLSSDCKTNNVEWDLKTQGSVCHTVMCRSLLEISIISNIQSFKPNLLVQWIYRGTLHFVQYITEWHSVN